MSDKEKLLPCPFCGGKAKLKNNHICKDMSFGIIYNEIYVSCENCNCQTKTILVDWHCGETYEKEISQAEQEAIKTWNKRI